MTSWRAPPRPIPRALIVGAAAALAFVLAACAPESADPAVSEPPASAAPSAVSSDQVTFLSVVDGDTIRTSAGTVRIIGIDTPESGQCGHDEASAAIGALLSSGDAVALELPEGENDEDSYGRLIRYVITAAGVDLGLLQLEQGNAVARYDSTDGYPAHPREEQYHAAQRATLGADGVVTVTCASTPEASPIAPSTDSGEQWWLAYTSCTKLQRNAVGDPTGPFSRDDPAQAEIYDWFANRTGNNGDGDSDGLACEGG